MRPSPPGSARLALPLVLVLLAAMAPAAQAGQADLSPAATDGDGVPVLQDQAGAGTVHYTVEAHDTGPNAAEEGDYWFTWNQTGEAENPPLLLPAGSHVVIEFVNRGAQQHNLHVGGGIDASTELIGEGESRTLEFDVPEDAPEDLEYWCDPHEDFGMAGNATTSEARFQELTTEGLEVTGHDDGASEYWFTTAELGEEVENPPILLKPGFTYEVTFTIAEGAATDHDWNVGAPVNANTSLISPGETDTVNFTVPSNATGTLPYWCQPHRALGMEGTVYTNATAYEAALDGLVGDGEHMDIEALGVDYLAYWVGVIAFALLFVVYGAYFYLFKYGESATTSDHKDRTRDEPTGQEATWNRIVGWILFLATVATVFTLAAAQLGAL